MRLNAHLCSRSGAEDGPAAREWPGLRWTTPLIVWEYAARSLIDGAR